MGQWGNRFARTPAWKRHVQRISDALPSLRTPNLEAALDDRAGQTVVVTLPPAHHLEWTLRALGAGKDVVVEEPAFPRAVDVRAVRAAAGTGGRRVFVAENYFYKPLRRTLRRLLAEGAVGQPLFLQINAMRRQRIAGWRDDATLACGGALLEGGIHWINFLDTLGLTVRAVHGYAPSRNGRPDRSMLVVVGYGGGTVGTLHYSWEIPSPLRGLHLSRIAGTAGTITFETHGLGILVTGRRPRFRAAWRDIAGYRAMWRDFLGALTTGGEPAMTLDQAERDLRLVESIYASLD